jgi:hypothetical protein
MTGERQGHVKAELQHKPQHTSRVLQPPFAVVYFGLGTGCVFPVLGAMLRMGAADVHY